MRAFRDPHCSIRRPGALGRRGLSTLDCGVIDPTGPRDGAGFDKTGRSGCGANRREWAARRARRRRLSITPPLLLTFSNGRAPPIWTVRHSSRLPEGLPNPPPNQGLRDSESAARASGECPGSRHGLGKLRAGEVVPWRRQPTRWPMPRLLFSPRFEMLSSLQALRTPHASQPLLRAQDRVFATLTRNLTTVFAGMLIFCRVWVWRRKSSKKLEEGVSASLVINNRRIQFNYRVIIGYAHAPIGG